MDKANQQPGVPVEQLRKLRKRWRTLATRSYKAAQDKDTGRDYRDRCFYEGHIYSACANDLDRLLRSLPE